MVGALASGRIRVEGGVVTSSFFSSWLGVFPILVGLYALVSCTLNGFNVPVPERE